VVEEPDYIEPNLLGPGGFLLIGGPPKAQKSWLVAGHARVRRDRTGVPGRHVPGAAPLRVFWLQAEMNEKLLRRRAKAMTGLTPDEINDLAANLIVSDRFRMILDPNGVEVASKLIREQFAGEVPDIIAFDPMANLFDQENENDNAQVMKFLTLRIEAVRQLVNPMAGVILVHHATKKGPDEIRKDPFNCFRGGGALRGHYDSGIIIFRKADDGEEREVHFELRSGDEPEPLTVTLTDGRMVKSASKFFPEDNQKGWPDRETCKLILAAIETAWRNGKPWSTVPQTAP
jgi:putative DNA primase/helicase